MASRSTVFLVSALLTSASAIACTTTVIERNAAPPAAAVEEAGTTDPPPDPVPDAGKDVVVVPPFVFKAAPEGTFAQAVSAGGSVVKAPKVVSILFATDSQKQIITDFSTKLATSTYWGQISAEYGVGALTSKPSIILTEPAPTTIDNSQIASWLVGKLQSDPTRFGTPDSSTLYAIYYPSGTTVTMGGGSGCTEFGGFHYETNAAGGTPISYAVMPRCAAFDGLAGSDVTTFAASHEILEWATDPFPGSSPAYNEVDADHAVWSRVFLGELGDLCVQGDTSVAPADLGATVQRTWSNASARAGHHPCAPVAKTPYFTAFPTALETLSVTDRFGRPTTTRGLKVGVGQTRTIDLTMYSDAPVGSWTVQVVDLSKLHGQSDEFSYQLDKTKGTSGDTLQLTITSLRPVGQGQGFLILSRAGTQQNLWPVWVTN